MRHYLTIFLHVLHQHVHVHCTVHVHVNIMYMYNVYVHVVLLVFSPLCASPLSVVVSVTSHLHWSYSVASLCYDRCQPSWNWLSY